jgi:hypothetical protein
VGKGVFVAIDVTGLTTVSEGMESKVEATVGVLPKERGDVNASRAWGEAQAASSIQPIVRMSANAHSDGFFGNGLTMS